MFLVNFFEAGTSTKALVAVVAEVCERISFVFLESLCPIFSKQHAGGIVANVCIDFRIFFKNVG